MYETQETWPEGPLHIQGRLPEAVGRQGSVCLVDWWYLIVMNKLKRYVCASWPNIQKGCHPFEGCAGCCFNWDRHSCSGIPTTWSRLTYTSVSLSFPVSRDLRVPNKPLSLPLAFPMTYCKMLLLTIKLSPLGGFGRLLNLYPGSRSRVKVTEK